MTRDPGFPKNSSSNKKLWIDPQCSLRNVAIVARATRTTKKDRGSANNVARPHPKKGPRQRKQCRAAPKGRKETPMSCGSKKSRDDEG